MKWFKHMSDASEDFKIIKIEEKFGVAGYAAYWKLVEYCARQWKPATPPVFKMTLKQTALVIRMKWKQTENVMETFSQLNLLSLERSGNDFIIKFPKLATIRDEHTAKAQRNSGVTPDKVPPDLEGDLEGDLEKDSKKKKAPTKTKKPTAPQAAFPVIDFFEFNNASIQNLISKIDPLVQENWSKMYPDKEWMRLTLFKVINWCQLNPKKVHSRSPKKWGQSLGAWFDKDWQNHLKAIPSNSQGRGYNPATLNLIGGED